MPEISATNLVAIIIALGTAFAAVITAWRTGQGVKKIDHNVAGLGEGLEKVHVAVNTNYQRMEGKLETAMIKISALEEAAARAETVRAVLASEVLKADLPPDVARAAEALIAAERAISRPVGSPPDAASGGEPSRIVKP